MYFTEVYTKRRREKAVAKYNKYLRHLEEQQVEDEKVLKTEQRAEEVEKQKLKKQVRSSFLQSLKRSSCREVER